MVLCILDLDDDVNPAKEELELVELLPSPPTRDCVTAVVEEEEDNDDDTADALCLMWWCIAFPDRDAALRITVDDSILEFFY